MEIQGYPNYLIYPDGRVWTKKNKIFLKHCCNTSGYLQVCLRNNDKIKNHDIHRLVAEYYIPNPENKRCVDHINRNRQDNRIENLRWVTDSENCLNRSKSRLNTSGHKNIRYYKKQKLYSFKKVVRKQDTTKYFKTLKEALCYKYIFTLKMRAGLV